MLLRHGHSICSSQQELQGTCPVSEVQLKARDSRIPLNLNLEDINLPISPVSSAPALELAGLLSKAGNASDDPDKLESNTSDSHDIIAKLLVFESHNTDSVEKLLHGAYLSR